MKIEFIVARLLKKSRWILIFFLPAVSLAQSPEFAPAKIKKFLVRNSTLLMSTKGAFLDTIRFSHTEEYPLNIGDPFCILRGGKIVVFYRSEKSCLLLYDARGNLLRKFSGYGTGPGEIMKTVKMDRKGDTLIVADEIQLKIILFDSDGKFIREVKPSRFRGAAGFRVSPVSDRYFFYHIFPYGEPAPKFTLGTLSRGFVREFGKFEDFRNIVARFSGVSPIVFDEKGRLYAIEPQTYGFSAYDDRGNFLYRSDAPLPEYFRPIEMTHSEFRKMSRDFQAIWNLWANHMTLDQIFYLGNGILLIAVRRFVALNTQKQLHMAGYFSDLGDTTQYGVESYLEFWTTDGKKIGVVFKPPAERWSVHSAEKGYIYYWQQIDPYLYENPVLVRYDFWKEIGLQ